MDNYSVKLLIILSHESTPVLHFYNRPPPDSLEQIADALLTTCLVGAMPNRDLLIGK